MWKKIMFSLLMAVCLVGATDAWAVANKTVIAKKPVIVKKAVIAKKSVAIKKTAKAPTVRVFKTTYTLANDIEPNVFTTKVGQPTRIDVYAQDGGRGCMSSIMIQTLAPTPIYLAQGQVISLSFTPKAKGKYLIVCAMNIPRGKVIVE